MLHKKEKLFYKIADQYVDDVDDFDITFLKGHKKAITCMQWLPDNDKIVTGSKDCEILLWDLNKQVKMPLGRGKKFDRSTEGHFDEVCCLAVSDNGKYRISGGKDRIVRVWDLHNQK